MCFLRKYIDRFLLYVYQKVPTMVWKYIGRYLFCIEKITIRYSDKKLKDTENKGKVAFKIGCYNMLRSKPEEPELKTL